MARDPRPGYAVKVTGIEPETHQIAGYFDTHEDAQRVIDLLEKVCKPDSLLEIVQLKWSWAGDAV